MTTEPCTPTNAGLSAALPPYAERLAAMHTALAEEFSDIVNKVPFRPGDQILDVGSGDGFFASLFADAGAIVTALDNDEAYLNYAREQTIGKGLKFVYGDARALPLPNHSVDVVWSGHCMQSHADLRKCFCEFRRVLKPGGTLAVLETDNVHSVMLPWPPDLELSVRQAEHRAAESFDKYVGTYFPRFGATLLTNSGFVHVTEKHILIDRYGSPCVELAEYVRLYLRDLHTKVHRHLGTKMTSRFRRLYDSDLEEFLPRQQHFYFRSLETLVVAQ